MTDVRAFGDTEWNVILRPAFGSVSIWLQDEILRAAVEPYAGPGLLLVHHNAQPHMARVCLQLNDALDAFSRKFTEVESKCTLIFHHGNAEQLSDRE